MHNELKELEKNINSINKADIASAQSANETLLEFFQEKKKVANSDSKVLLQEAVDITTRIEKRLEQSYRSSIAQKELDELVTKLKYFLAD